MTKVVEAIYKDGVFKPVKKLRLPKEERFKLIIAPIKLDERKVKKIVERQKKALKELVGIGDSGLGDISRNHDKYLYTKDW